MPKGIIIGSLVRHGEVIIPKGNTTIKPGDRIVVFCLSEDLQTLRLFFKVQKGGILNELWNRAKGTREHSNN